jgi:hypothetical protein
LQDAARRALQSLSEVALGEMKEEVGELLSLTKAEAIEMLCETLPQANGIQPLFVSADTPAAQLSIFEDPAIQLKVLGPMADIDAFYLGGEGLQNTGGGSALQGVAGGYQALFQPHESAAMARPHNISAGDFDQRGRCTPTPWRRPPSPGTWPTT